MVNLLDNLIKLAPRCKSDVAMMNNPSVLVFCFRNYGRGFTKKPPKTRVTPPGFLK